MSTIQLKKKTTVNNNSDNNSKKAWFKKKKHQIYGTRPITEQRSKGRAQQKKKKM